jgi:hypothetical protein
MGEALMCACPVYRWTEDRRAEVEAAIRSSRTRAEAAAKIPTTVDGLARAGQRYGFAVGAMLGRVKADERPAAVKEAEPEPAPVEWSGARPASTGAGLERRLIIGDLHIPFHHLPSCAAVLALARAVQPHLIIQLGDLFNMGAVSHHPRPFGGRENHAGAQVQGLAFLDALGRAAPGARKVVLLGNHDSWADEYEDERPEFAGLFAAKSMGLDRLGWELVPRRKQPIVIGPVAYLHGYGGGEHAAKKYVVEVCPQTGVKHVKAAHHHNVQRYHGKNGCEGWIAGWLGRPECPAFDYAPNRDHWERSVLIEDIYGEHVTTTPVILRNGAALFGGRLISRAA